MKIKKTFQGELPENRIVNAKSNSQTDAYSANYLNDKLNKVVVSLEEPTTGEEVWIKRSINTLKFSDFTKEVNGITFKMEDQVLSIKGTATAYTQECYMPIKKTLEEDMTLTQYTSGKADGLVAKAAYTDNGTSYYPNLFSVELNKDAYIDQLYFIISEGAVVDAEVRFQLERGKGTHDWQPVMEKQVFVKNENGVYEELVKKNLHVGIDEPKNGEDVWVRNSENLIDVSEYVATIYGGIDLMNRLTVGEKYNVTFNETGVEYLFLTKVGAYDAMSYDMLEIKTSTSFVFTYTQEMYDNGYKLHIMHTHDNNVLTYEEMQNFGLQIALSEEIYTKDATGYKRMYGKDDNLDVYLKQEQRVGTWIDGKPLYRTVLTHDTPSPGANANIFYYNPDIKEICSISGIVYRKGRVIALPIGARPGTDWHTYFDDTYANYHGEGYLLALIHMGTLWTENNFGGMHIIVEYTKITD